jgi:hypothetical protein
MPFSSASKTDSPCHQSIHRKTKWDKGLAQKTFQGNITQPLVQTKGIHDFCQAPAFRLDFLRWQLLSDRFFLNKCDYGLKTVAVITCSRIQVQPH